MVATRSLCAFRAAVVRLSGIAVACLVATSSIACGGASQQSSTTAETVTDEGPLPSADRVGDADPRAEDSDAEEGDVLAMNEQRGARRTETDAGRASADGEPKEDDEPKGAPAVEDPVGPKQRAALSEFLLPLARKAAKDAGTRGKAVSLFRGVVAARGAGDPVAIELARTYRLAEDYEAAADTYRAFAAATRDRDAARKARAEADEVDAQPTPFNKQFEVAPALAEARSVWNKGRKAMRGKHWSDALVYFQMAAGLAPDMPGPMRELGTVYRRLDRPGLARDYFHAYLRRRPVGRIADEVRKQLAEEKDRTLGKLTVTGTSKLPCEEIWVQGLRAPGKLPLRDLRLPRGTYRWLCFNARYGLALFKSIDVPEGGRASLDFKWAVVVNGLEKPYGRVRIEHWENPDLMIDLGLGLDEVGVPVPDDGRALRLTLISDDRSRIVERLIKLDEGKRTVIKW